MHVSVAAENTGPLTDPELVSHVAKPCYVLPPAFHEVQPASGTALEHLKTASCVTVVPRTFQIICHGLLVTISTTRGCWGIQKKTL